MTARGTLAQGKKEEQVFDSPTGWVAKHVRSYIETGGKKGHLYHGMPTLLLTTRGRKSGKLRRTALIYGQDGDRYVLAASNGGAQKHLLGTSTCSSVPTSVYRSARTSFRHEPAPLLRRRSRRSGKRWPRSFRSTTATRRRPAETSPW